jgi:hypothetical protein
MPVGKFVSKAILADLERLVQSEEPLDQEAFALVCLASDNAKAKELLEKYLVLKEKAEIGVFSWKNISEKWHEQNPS